MSPSTELPELDPFVEDFQQFPFATLALLRERAPVHAMAEPGWYIVTTIELAREVLTDPARFSNQVSRRTSPPAAVAGEGAAIRAQGPHHRRRRGGRPGRRGSGPRASDTFRPCC